MAPALKARARVGVLAVQDFVGPRATDAVVESAPSVEAIVAAPPEQGVWAVAADEHVGAGRALDLLNGFVDVAAIASAHIGVQDAAADRCLHVDAPVLDAGEGCAVVVAGTAIELISIAGLAADQQVVAGATEHERCAAVLSRMKDVDSVEDIVPAPAFEPVRDVVISCIEDVVAVATDEFVAAPTAVDGRGNTGRNARVDAQRIVPGAEGGLDRGDRPQAGN